MLPIEIMVYPKRESQDGLWNGLWNGLSSLFPVKRLDMPIPKSIPFTETVHCLLTHHVTLHLLNFEHHCTRRLMFTFQLIVITCALT